MGEISIIAGSLLSYDLNNNINNKKAFECRRMDWARLTTAKSVHP